MRQQRAGVAGRFGLRRRLAAAHLQILFGGFAGHLHVAAQRQQADHVVGFAALEAEEPRAEAEAEGLDAHLAELGDDEVSQLVRHHHDADQNQKRDQRDDGRAQIKLMWIDVNAKHASEIPLSGPAVCGSGQQLARSFPRLAIRSKHLRDGRRVGLRGCRKHLLNCTWDAHKWDTTIEESCDGHLVGGVEGDAMSSAFFRGLKGEAQAREALQVGLLEVEVRERGEVEGKRGWRAARDKRARRG